FPEPFEDSNYGMYSLQLKREVTVLECEGLVKETPDTVAPGLPSFVLEATPQLDEVIKEFELAEPTWAARAKKLNAMSPRKLEGISTVLFLRQTLRNSDAVRGRLLALKPHL